MSEFLAEGLVIVRPDTSKFRAELLAQLAAIKIPPISVPIVATAATGLGTVVAGTAALSGAQATLSRVGKDLTVTEQILDGVYVKQRGDIATLAVATTEAAAAQTVLDTASKRSVVTQNQVGKAAIANTAGMLGLRGAVLTAGGAFIAATIAFQGLGKAVGSAISFEKELNVFQATVGATADQMVRVQEVSRELGRDITLPGVAANDAAQALSSLARAGLDVEQALGAVRGTLQLATAAEIDNANAAELVANALNSFKLPGEEATRVADLLAGASNEAQGSITDMGLALKQTSAIASGLGISVQDTVTILTQLARAGLSASDAGTSFRQTLLRLIQDLPKVNKEVERLGLDLRDAQGNIRPQVFEELGRKLQRLAPAARQLAIANLGGADAIRTLLILTRAQAGEFDAVQAAVTRAGIAQELAAARTKGLGGDIEATKNQLADFGLTLGRFASGPIGILVRSIGEGTRAINDLNSAIEELTGGEGLFDISVLDGVKALSTSFSRLNFSFRDAVRNAHATEDAFESLGSVAGVTADLVGGLNNALQQSADATRDLGGGATVAEGLNVQQVLNRIAGFDERQVRAKIREDSEALLAALRAEQAFLEQQLQREFVQRREPLRRRLQNALLAVTSEISSIQKAAASESKQAIADAERASREADQALLAFFAQKRQGIENALAAAETSGQQIRLQNRLQAEIKREIAAIRKTVEDERTRRDAILDLRAALIASQQAERELREQQRQEALERRERLLELNLQIAETTGNLGAQERALKRQIAFFKKQRDLTAAGTIARKEWILKIVEARQQLKEIEEEQNKLADQSKRTFQQDTFDFLQAQQGFVSNLLSNLIPTSAAGGLVGGTTPAPSGPGPIAGGIIAIGGAAQAQAQAGPSSGQAQTTNAILMAILNQLKKGNQDSSAPESSYQRWVGTSISDGAGKGTLDG